MKKLLFEDIIHETVLFIPVTISSRTPIKNRVIEHNKIFLNKFKHIVVVINSNHRTDLCNDLWGRTDPETFTEKHAYEYGQKWKKEFGKKVTILFDVVNRGWQFGTMDLDLFAYDYIKLNWPKTKWVMRSEENVAYFPKFLNTEINDADLVVMPYFTFDSRSMLIDGYYTDKLKEFLYDMVKERYAIHRMVDFQTSHYIVNINKVSRMYYPISIMKKYYETYIKNKKEKPDKSTLMLKDNPVFRLGVETELVFKSCIQRQNVKINLMMNKTQFVNLCKMGCSIPMLPTEPDTYPFDLAFKNIFFENLGWYHFHPEQKNVPLTWANLENGMWEINSRKLPKIGKLI